MCMLVYYALRVCLCITVRMCECIGCVYACMHACVCYLCSAFACMHSCVRSSHMRKRMCASMLSHGFSELLFGDVTTRTRKTWMLLSQIAIWRHAYAQKCSASHASLAIRVITQAYLCVRSHVQSASSFRSPGVDENGALVDDACAMKPGAWNGEGVSAGLNCPMNFAKL